jgi:hypothetical protein
MAEPKAPSAKGRLYWQVSALALAAAGGAGSAQAAEATEGGVTLELQGQYDFDASGKTQSFIPTSGIPNALNDTKDGYDVAGKITYQPDGSPYSFALGVRYGRTKGPSRSFHYTYQSTYIGTYDQTIQHRVRERHTTVDFEVGKDVGLGMGGAGVTTLGVGLRYAQLDVTTRGSFATSSKYTSRAGAFRISRRAKLFGPRIFFKSTTALGSGGFSLGVGGGAGVLFGRQSTHGNVDFATGSYGGLAISGSRSKRQTTPTLDGFAQLNWRAPGSPMTISAGYRFDGYFKALNGSLIGNAQINVIEHGPYLGVIWKIR